MLLKIIVTCLIIFHVNATSEKICNTFLRELANEQTLLLYCITTNSVPVTMCRNCIGHHKDVLVAYDTLATNCTSMYFDKDRINLVASTESVLTGLWTKAYCDDCFNNNNSQEFDEKNTNLYNCLQTSKPNNPCDKCKIQYLDLNDFFIKLDQHNNGEVCYDLQDSMNRTRNKWSKELNCCRRDYNIMLFTVALCITSCLPLLFYAITYLITKRQERNHDVLNDEDPLYNSATSSTSARANINNLNNTTQSVINNDYPSISTTNTSNNPTNERNFNILELSDDESMINTTINSKEKLK